MHTKGGGTWEGGGRGDWLFGSQISNRQRGGGGLVSIWVETDKVLIVQRGYREIKPQNPDGIICQLLEALLALAVEMISTIAFV